MAKITVALSNHESPPLAVELLPKPTVTVYTFPGVTLINLLAKAPPPPPPAAPLLEREPPFPPPPQAFTITLVTPAGTVKVDEVSKTSVVG